MRAARRGGSMGQGIGRLVSGIGDRVVGTVFPPVCAGCGAETASPATLCADCWTGLHFLAGPGCASCGREVPGLAPGEPFRCDDCRRHAPLWTAGAAAFVYEGTGRKLVLALKHGDRLDSVPMLAGWMHRAGRPLIARADLIVPVPLHWTRMLRRRFNQSTELARALAGSAGRRNAFRPDALKRVRRTPSQDGRSREDRARNLAGALAVPPRWRPLLQGRRVLLIDDVMTTGATLNAAARVLLDAGARRVDMLVLALVGGAGRSYLERPAESEEIPT